MSIKEKYTTQDLITSDKTQDKIESKKIPLSNDAYAIAQLLETLINKMGRL